MSYNGHVVVDMDCHIFEGWDLDRTFKDNMDPEYREKYVAFSQAKGKLDRRLALAPAASPVNGCLRLVRGSPHGRRQRIPGTR